MANSTKDRQIFEKHVESTLLLVEIHRCKICNFYSSHSGAMSDHIRASHAPTLGGDVARVSGEALQQQQDPDTPLKYVLNEFQNLQCLKSLSKDQVVLKILSNLRKDCGGFQLKKSEKVEDPELNLSKLYEFLISESKSFESERLPQQDSGFFRQEIEQDITEERQVKTSTSGLKVKNSVGNSVVRRTMKSKSHEYRAKLAKINRSKADSTSTSSIKLDFNRAYENMLEAAKVKNDKEREKTSVVDLHVSSEDGEGKSTLDWHSKEQFVDKSQSLDEPMSQGQAPGPTSEPVQIPVSTSEPVQVPLPQLSLLEPEAMSKEENAATSSSQEKNPQNDTQSSQIAEVNIDSIAGPSTGEDIVKNDMAASSGDKDHTQDEAQPTPQTLPILKGSKLYGSIDFQAIAQQASQSNPEATTITVVQHTGGNRPPMTIHFKKSLKSKAIIPTGESLGIESPFLRKEYSGCKIFACQECHSRYKTANELNRHVLKKHQKKKSYLCEICGDALATRSGMKIHIMRKHAVSDVLTCKICNYVTRSSARLTVHLKKHNKGTSAFFCEPCKKSFVTESKLQQHTNSPMHKNAVDPIICEHCGYVTKKRDNFLVHIRKHTGEKPYRCNHCDYGAADGSTLKRHVMARHSSIRPFRCSQCEFSCVDKKGLTVHMRKHTGERPFICDLCPYAAKRSGALTVHRRTHFHEKSSVPSSKEDITVDAGTEVASYVDISDISIAHVPLTSLPPSRTQPAIQVSTQNPDSSSVPSIAATHQGITTSQSSNATVELPPEVITSQETDQTVRALWQSIS